MVLFKFIRYTLIPIIIFIVGCGNGGTSTERSPKQYQDVALQYLHALSKGDFNTYMELNWSNRKLLEEYKQSEPAFDRQRRVDGYLSQERQQFNMLLGPGDGGYGGMKWIFNRIKGAQLRVVEVGPVVSIGAGKVADVFVEAQGRERIIVVVPVLNTNGRWGVFGDLRLHR